jgi:hypothetical protein
MSDLDIIEYDGDKGLVADGRDLTIIMDGVKTIVEDVEFYDPIRGVIQTKHTLFVPKGFKL